MNKCKAQNTIPEPALKTQKNQGSSGVWSRSLRQPFGASLWSRPKRVSTQIEQKSDRFMNKCKTKNATPEPALKIQKHQGSAGVWVKRLEQEFGAPAWSRRLEQAQKGLYPD